MTARTADDRPVGSPRQAGFTQEHPVSGFEIVFDGGALGNPGHGYGSFHISGADEYLVHEKLDFAHLGNRVTNNQAEYRTLIAALHRLLSDVADTASSTRVVVRGDSLLVINQLAGRWKVKNADLAPLHREAGTLLRRFAAFELLWHDRSHSVRILGH